MFGSRCVIERNFNNETTNNVFSKMNEIINHHAPEENPIFNSKAAHPIISFEQALKELSEISKNEINTN